jgi:hypothetical protein
MSGTSTGVIGIAIEIAAAGAELLYRVGIAARDGIRSTVVAIEELVQTHRRESTIFDPVIADRSSRAADRRPQILWAVRGEDDLASLRTFA